jgi:hypothetical protein
MQVLQSGPCLRVDRHGHPDMESMPMSGPHYFQASMIRGTSESIDADICVYGGTSAGIVAAVAAAKRGRSVVLLQPGTHLGGMSTGGLGLTDYGKRHVIGGMSRQFYRDLGKHYSKEEEWYFEPHAASGVFDRLLSGTAVVVRRGQFLDTVAMTAGRIVSVKMLGGLTVTAKQFIDATYEGDLLAKAGVSHHIGREDNQKYGETLNGAQVLQWHQFSHAVDPYVVEGVPSSGLLPGVEPIDMSQQIGRGDQRLQAYNFRVCMTDDPALRVAWKKPTGFDPKQYILAARWFSGEKDQYNEHLHAHEPGTIPVPRKFDVFPNRTAGGHRKTDTNNHGAVSSDFIGNNWRWPFASYQEREEIFQAHVTYQQGYYWFVANDPSIPERYRQAYSVWGLPSDEFTDTGHWPHQLYVRESRRMISDYVITEGDCRGTRIATDSVGMGSYTLDSHNCTRFVWTDPVTGKPRVRNEGDVQVPPTDPYPISYRAIVPSRGQCANLFVPVCISASHIAYGSARMEPVFMVLAESSAIAADIAIREKIVVQDVPYDALRPELLKAQQVLELPKAI